ncbi:MAG: hypothetical protein OHK0053_31020 [Microscillaceae bacterium]
MVLALWLAGCSGRRVAPTGIPEGVSLVACFDFKSMSSKALNARELLQLALEQGLAWNQGQQHTNTHFLKHLLQSGLDFQQKAYLFGQLPQETSLPYLAFRFGLTNPSGFEKKLKENYPDFKPQQEASCKTWQSKGIHLSWADSTGILLLGLPNVSAPKLEQKADELWEMRNKAGLERKNRNLRDFLLQDFDLGVWIDYTRLAQAAPPLPLSLPSEKLFNLVESLDYTLSFEKGRLDMNSRTVFNASTAGEYRKLLQKKLQGGFLAQLPVTSPLGFAGLRLGLSGLQKMLDDWGGTSLLDGFLTFAGTDTRSLLKMFDGQIAISLETLRVQAESSPGVEGLICLGVAEYEAVQQLLDKMSGLFLKKKKDYYALGWGEARLYILLQKEALYLVTNELLRESILDGKYSPSPRWQALGKDQTGFFYADIARLSGSWYPNEAKKDNPLLIMQHLEGQTLPLEGKILKTRASVFLKDRTRNALPALLQLIKDFTLPPGLIIH